jgi:MFS superfamily sulfate permease-like transporter
VADLGVLVPISAALVLQNGLDAATILVGAGAFYLLAGLYFRVPIPVQPIKAAAAIAIASGLGVETIAAAGIILGVIMFILGRSGAAAKLAGLFSLPLVRGLQLGVGLLLLQVAFRLLPAGSETSNYILVLVIAALLTVASIGTKRLPAALAIVVTGIGYSLVAGSPIEIRAELWQPLFAAGSFDPAVLWSALILLVIPQIPLTFGNAVVAVTDLERSYFGPQASRATPAAVSTSCGLANIAVGALGGMPMCHGASGLTAHYRAGARTYKMNVIAGGALLTLGILFGPTAFQLFALIPTVVLAGLLTFTGVHHSLLVLNVRGYDLAIALVTGLTGWATSNLTIGLAAGLLLLHAPGLATVLSRSGGNEQGYGSSRGV